jgi:hypothetical protein
MAVAKEPLGLSREIWRDDGQTGIMMMGRR